VAFFMRRGAGSDVAGERSQQSRGHNMVETDSKGDRMSSVRQNKMAWVAGALSIGLLIALITSVAAMSRAGALAEDLDAAEAELEAVRDDFGALRDEMEQVRGGAALFSAQVTLFQEQLAGLAPAVASGLDDAIGGLETFATSTLEFSVPINENVPIDTVIDLNRVITVPVQTTIPIDETVETTITVAGPFGIDIPLNVTVPVQLDLPIDLDVAFTIDESVPISANVPVNLDLPIEIVIADTGLATLVESLSVGLESMQGILEGLQ
jgi:hypothetical protein